MGKKFNCLLKHPTQDGNLREGQTSALTTKHTFDGTIPGNRKIVGKP
jgi:hypothetical protein